MRHSLKRNKGKHRKGGAFPHCAAAKPRWLIEGRIGMGNHSRILPRQAAHMLELEESISTSVEKFDNPMAQAIARANQHGLGRQGDRAFEHPAATAGQCRE